MKEKRNQTSARDAKNAGSEGEEGEKHFRNVTKTKTTVQTFTQLQKNRKGHTYIKIDKQI